MQLVRTHPITGQPTYPLGFTRKGKAVWPVAGGSTPAGDPAASGTGTGTTSPAGTPAGSTTTTGTPAGSTTDTSGQPKLVPQDEVDRIVESRLARERAKFADHDQLREKATRLDALEAANASELDKAVKTAKREAEGEVTTRFQGILRASAVREVAAALKFRDAGDALAQLQVAGKLDTIAVDANGVVDREAVQRELTTLTTQKPYLLADQTTPPPPPPATPAQAGVGGAASTTTSTTKTVAPGMGRLRAGYEALSKQ